MSDVLMGVLGGVMVTVVTQLLAARISARQWERSEARRREEIALEDTRRKEEYRRADALHQEEIKRQEARRLEDLKAARLREFWECALQTNFQLSALMKRKRRKESVPFDQELPSDAAVKACAVALLGLDALYQPAKRLGQATAKVEMLLSRLEADQTQVEPEDSQQMMTAMHDWKSAFIVLEKEVAKMTGVSPGRAQE